MYELKENPNEIILTSKDNQYSFFIGSGNISNEIIKNDYIYYLVYDSKLVNAPIGYYNIKNAVFIREDIGTRKERVLFEIGNCNELKKHFCIN